MKKAVSLTIEEANLLWVKGQATARDGNVSSVVDELITEARRGGRQRPGSVRSVVGTIDLPDDDPDLLRADEHIRSVYERSLRRPVLAKERSARFSVRAKRRG
jgi:hypothetical protein